MASRKNLKKVISYIVDELATEAFYLSCNSKAETAAWVDLFNKVFALNKEYIARVNHAEPGLPARKYFNTLCASFNEEAKTLLEEMQQLAKAE